MILRNAQHVDAGHFLCLVTNKAGSVEKLFKVRVLLKPKLLNPDEPYFLEVLLNDSVVIDCPVIQKSPMIDSQVKIMWTKNGRPIDDIEGKVRQTFIIKNILTLKNKI